MFLRLIARWVVLGFMLTTSSWVLYGVGRAYLINGDINLINIGFAVIASFLWGISFSHMLVYILIRFGILEVEEGEMGLINQMGSRKILIVDDELSLDEFYGFIEDMKIEEDDEFELRDKLIEELKKMDPDNKKED